MSYLVIAWLAVQVISVIGPALGLDNQFMRYTLLVLVAGFPVAMLLSWFFAFTTRGIARESELDDTAVEPQGRSLDFALIGVLATALLASFAYIGWTKSLDGAPRTAQNAAAAEEPSVLAVLPLATLTANTSDNGFVDGLHDDLLNTLSQLRPLRVISRTSVLGFRDTDMSIGAIGKELGANKIIEGSIQLVNTSIRISVKLIDVTTDSQLWANSYQREFNASEMFALQRDIALAIADELKVALSLTENERLQALPTTSTEAYRLYLLGRQRTAERTSASLKEAITFLERAITLDTQYADAYAELALAHNLTYHYSGLPLDDMYQRAMPLVQRALELDPAQSEALVVLAELRAIKGDPTGAEEAYKKALALNPNSALARHWYGIFLADLARYEDALDQLRQALKLDPLSPVIAVTLAQDYTYLGDTESAMAEYERALEVSPDFIPLYAHLAAMNRLSLRRPDESVRWLRKAWEMDPEHTEYPSQMAESLLDLNQPEAARLWCEKALKLGPNRFWPNRAMMQYAWFTGDAELLGRYSDSMAEVSPMHFNVLMFKVQQQLDRGETETAARLFLPEFAELSDSPPRVDKGNYAYAVLLAYVLLANDEQERARTLLNLALEVMEDVPRTGFNGKQLLDVAALGLLGQSDRADARLKDANDSLWSNGWWVLRHQPLYESVRNLPEAQALTLNMRRSMNALADTLTDEADPVTP